MSDANTTFKPLEITDIKKRIPHRYPFLLIDRVIDINVEEQTAVAIKAVSGNEPFFEGHFPSKPIMPGVLTVEAMAQTAAVFVTEAVDAATGKLVFFMTVDKARFRRPITPGDQIRIEVKLLRSKGSVYRFEGKAKVDGKVAAEAEFAAMIVDQEQE
ncbi:MAG: 3-hydroxyacyl-ACP dehydratase FabZ [Alphaproteobacteria bacterium]